MAEHEQKKGDTQLEEDLILAWIHATGVLKNTRITQKMIYNEAVVMSIVYERYREDGVGAVTFGEICRRTRMLKSLVNRTIGTLASRGFLERRTGEDKRTTYVVPVKKKLPEFLEEHERSPSSGSSAKRTRAPSAASRKRCSTPTPSPTMKRTIKRQKDRSTTLRPFLFPLSRQLSAHIIPEARCSIRIPVLDRARRPRRRWRAWKRRLRTPSW